jgi:hypothetical protein
LKMAWKSRAFCMAREIFRPCSNKPPREEIDDEYFDLPPRDIERLCSPGWAESPVAPG